MWRPAGLRARDRGDLGDLDRSSGSSPGWSDVDGVAGAEDVGWLLFFAGDGGADAGGVEGALK